MAKFIGALLIISGIAALAAGAFIEMNYGATAEITGRVISAASTGNFLVFIFYHQLYDGDNFLV